MSLNHLKLRTGEFIAPQTGSYTFFKRQQTRLINFAVSWKKTNKKKHYMLTRGVDFRFFWTCTSASIRSSFQCFADSSSNGGVTGEISIAAAPELRADRNVFPPQEGTDPGMQVGRRLVHIHEQLVVFDPIHWLCK